MKVFALLPKVLAIAITLGATPAVWAVDVNVGNDVEASSVAGTQGNFKSLINRYLRGLTKDECIEVGEECGDEEAGCCFGDCGEDGKCPELDEKATRGGRGGGGNGCGWSC